MENNSEKRLDRLEALADKILEGLQETREIVNSNAKAIQALGDAVQETRAIANSNAKAIQALGDAVQETRAIANSNAKAIQALGDAVTRDREKAERDRARLYEAMARMAAAQSHFWQIQEDYYTRLEEIDKRQAQTAEILDKISQRLEPPNG